MSACNEYTKDAVLYNMEADKQSLNTFEADTKTTTCFTVNLKLRRNYDLGLMTKHRFSQICFVMVYIGKGSSYCCNSCITVNA